MMLAAILLLLRNTFGHNDFDFETFKLRELPLIIKKRCWQCNKCFIFFEFFLLHFFCVVSFSYVEQFRKEFLMLKVQCIHS